MNMILLHDFWLVGNINESDMYYYTLVIDALWIFTDNDCDDDNVQCLPSNNVDVLCICVHRVLFFYLEIKSLNIPAMTRAQGNSFLK